MSLSLSRSFISSLPHFLTNNPSNPSVIESILTSHPNPTQPISLMASLSSYLEDKDQEDAVQDLNISDSFICSEDVSHPSADPKTSKNTKKPYLLSITNLKLKIPKPFKRRSLRSNSFIIFRTPTRLDDPREIPTNQPSSQSDDSSDKNTLTSSVSDQSSSFGSLKTEESQVSCDKQKINGKDWTDLVSRMSLDSELSSDGCNQSITVLNAVIEEDNGVKNVGCDTENLSIVRYKKRGQRNFVAIILSLATFNLSSKKKLVNFVKSSCSSTESNGSNSIACRSSYSSYSDGESGLSSRVPTKLERMKWMVKSSCLPMKSRETKNGKDEIWRKRILMGRRCQPLNFLGIIYFDEDGNQLEGLPRPRREFTWEIKHRIHFVDRNGEADDQLVEVVTRN